MAGTNRYKLATWKFCYCLKWSCYLQNIFVNPCEFLGLCWVVFRSHNFADAKRKEVVCITLGFFPNSASGNGIWALGSGISKKKWAGKWDWYPPFRTLTWSCYSLSIRGEGEEEEGFKKTREALRKPPYLASCRLITFPIKFISQRTLLRQGFNCTTHFKWRFK